MPEILLNANLRKNRGKSANQQLRHNGKIPAVLYGPRGNFSLEMEEEATRQALAKLANTHELVKLKVDGSSANGSWEGQVLLKEIQKHIYKNRLIHLDFLEPPKGKPLSLKIRIQVVGESPGVKEGGVLQLVVREIPVICMPDQIPAYVEIDVSQLKMGQTLNVQEIQLPEQVSLKTRQNFPVVSIVGRTKDLEEEEAALMDDEGALEQEADEDTKDEESKDEE